VRGNCRISVQALVPGTSASSLAKLGSSGRMSQPPGRILLHAGMRDMVRACGLDGPGRHVCANARSGASER